MAASTLYKCSIVNWKCTFGILSQKKISLFPWWLHGIPYVLFEILVSKEGNFAVINSLTLRPLPKDTKEQFRPISCIRGLAKFYGGLMMGAFMFPRSISGIRVWVKWRPNTVVPGFKVFGFRALPGFRAQNPGDRAWSVHKTLFGFRAPLSQLFI